MARPKRFELLTPRFVVWCSIQLSYGRVFRLRFGLNSPHAFRTKSGPRESALATGSGPAWQGPAAPVAADRRPIAGSRKGVPYARARSLRMVSSSTGRSGITIRKVAPMVPSTRWMSPPWARTSSAAMARPSPEPPGRPEVWNASNRCSRALRRHAGAGVGNLQDRDRAFAASGDADLHGRGIAARPSLQRLRRVAHQIEQHAKQLVGIGVDRQPALDRVDPGDRGVGGKARGFADLRRRTGSIGIMRRSGAASCARP